ncbi:MAG: hypothetical protein WCT40_04420, partial [Candidatus Magasanikbacteria bacterium]
MEDNSKSWFQTRQNRIFLVFGGFALAVISLVFFSFARVYSSSAPTIITYQGKLLQNSVAVTSTLPMKFVIYDALTGGNEIYTASGTINVNTTTVLVTPVNGLFSINLGDTAGSPATKTLDPSIFQNHDTLYLEVTVDGEVLSPRKRITSVPYAFNSKYLDGHIATSTPTTTAYVPVADSSGNFHFNNVSSTALSVVGNLHVGNLIINGSGAACTDGQILQYSSSTGALICMDAVFNTTLVFSSSTTFNGDT